MERLRILLVEDDHDSRVVLAKLLRLSGYEVHTAGTADEAIALAGQCACDLVVSDLGLPDRTGLELMREIRSTYGLGGIALTGRCADDAIDWQRAGFCRYVQKPVDLGRLRAAIESVATRRVA